MACSVAPRQQRPICLQWKKWMKACDPAPYKGCIVFLLTLCQLCCSGLEHCRRKMEDGPAQVWWLVRKGEVRMVEVSGRSSAVMVMSSLAQLLVLLCGDVHPYPSHDDGLSGSGDTALLAICPSSGDQFCCYGPWSRHVHFFSFPDCVVTMAPYLTPLAVHLWRYVQQYFSAHHSSLCHSELHIWNKKQSCHFSLPLKLRKSVYLQCCVPLLWTHFSSSSLPALWKCVKTRVPEAVMWARDQLCSPRGRAALRLGVLAVFVNQMLLMMAGDVEPNPGPGLLGPDDFRDVLNAMFQVRNKWYYIGLELKIPFHTLNVIRTEHHNSITDCLTEMLQKWLTSTSPPPTWTDLVQALLSEPVEEKRLAEEIREKYCHQDEGQATSLPQPAELGPPSDTPSVSGTALTETPTESGRGERRGKRKSDQSLDLTQSTMCGHQAKEVKMQRLVPSPLKPTVPHSSHIFTPSPATLLNVSQTQSPSPPTPSPSPSPSPLTCYADYLRAVYAKSPVAIDDKWPPTPSTTYVRLALIKKEKVSQGEADHFTRLTLQGDIDKILKAKQPIAMDDILRGNIRLVVVEGAPGIGKTTFAWELCRQWDTLESLKRFSLVVLLGLREDRVQTATAISDILYHRNTELRRCVGEEVERRDGEGVLLVFDGFDEFPAEFRRKSLVADLISGSYLPKATVLVTSRPSATAALLSPQVGKRIEVVGFSDKQIQEYAESILGCESELLTSFQTYLSVNPMVRGMTYNPLNCGMVVEVYRESSQSHRPIPHTQTQLYTELSLCLLSRHLSAAGDPLARRLPDRLEDIPHDSDLYQQLVRLGKLAFEGRVREEVIFKQLPEGCSILGLLNTCSELYRRREKVTYNFLHLTLQEYLGAFYISQLPASEQRKLFVENCELRRLNVVWRFVAGLTRMQAIGWEGFRGRNIKEEYEMYFGDEDSGYVVVDGVVLLWPSVVQCLYEAQDAGSCASVFGQSRVEYHGQWCSTPFDAYAVGYCISLCRNDWNVDLSKNGLGPEVVEMFMCGLQSVQYGGGSVGELDLSGNPIKHEGVKLLQQFPHQILQQMRRLHLSDCGLGQTGFDLLADTVPLLSSLESLDISGNPGGKASTVKLLQALGKHQRVKHLRMDHTVIGRDDATALSEMVRPSGSLRYLDIGSYNISPECVGEVVRTVLSPSSLQTVEVYVPSSVSPLDCIETISDSLTRLVFVSPGASSEQLPAELSCSRLSDILKENTTLKELRLLIPLGNTEVRAIVESLKHNHTLTELRLSGGYHHQYFSWSERQDHRITWGW